MSNTRLSNSAVNKYLSCGMAYKLHYIDKLREGTKSAALIFGDSIDNALNALLKGKADPVYVFNQYWSKNKITDDNLEDIPENPLVRYADADFDRDLLQEEDMLYLDNRSNELGFHSEPLDVFKQIADKKKQVGYDKLEDRELKFFNLVNWLSLKRKAPIMIESYKNVVMPRIKVVHDVQKYIKIENDIGDTVIGYVDLIVDYEHTDGKVYKIIADNKTSTMDYTRDSVVKSQQLTIYAIAENITHAAFFVIKKQIQKNRVKKCNKCGFDGIKENKRLTTAKTCDTLVEGKRCHGEWTEVISPEARIDIIFDEIKDYNKSIVTETLDHVNNGIKNGIFPRNYQSCGNFGGCAYSRYCHYGDKKGLIQK